MPPLSSSPSQSLPAASSVPLASEPMGEGTSVLDTSVHEQQSEEARPPQMEKWRELRKSLFSQINDVAAAAVAAGGAAEGSGDDAERMAALEAKLTEMDQAFVSKSEEAEEYEKRIEEMAGECSEYREKMIHYQQAYEE